MRLSSTIRMCRSATPSGGGEAVVTMSETDVTEEGGVRAGEVRPVLVVDSM
jgi:hypothetical protein